MTTTLPQDDGEVTLDLPRRADGAAERAWPAEGITRVPYWLYSAPDVYRRELERIFYGPSWNYVALAAEIPDAGDFKRTTIGQTPVVVVRGKQGQVDVLVNRCAHRGVQFCHESQGSVSRFTCPYHQWSFGLDGRLLGIPFRKGVNGHGGMPEGFEPAEHGLQRLHVAERHGVVFASFTRDMPPFETYLGETNLGWFDRVFDGRELVVLGYQRQRVPANWKLMFENIKDPYHATLLHVFLVTFGLFRADNPSATQMDDTGMHAALVSSKGEQRANHATAEMPGFRGDLQLADPRLLDPVAEFPGEATVVMQTIWPNLIVQQQSNTLAMRQLVPQGPTSFELHWTYFGYADDDAEMHQRRLRQANLMGPGGFVSIDDSEVMRLAQRGAEATGEGAALLEMGGTETGDIDHIVTEAAIRAFYVHYRRVMEL